MTAAISERPRRDPIKQFSVFADNKVGRLNDLLQILAERDLHVLAFASVDTTDSAILRLVVNYPTEARNLLREHGYTFSEVELIGVELVSGADLRKVTCGLVQAEINIHYAYPFIIRPNDNGALAMRLEDNELGAEVIRKQGLRVLDQSDIAR